MKMFKQCIWGLSSMLALVAGLSHAENKKEVLSLSHGKVNITSKVGAAAPASVVITANVSNTKSKVYYVVESSTSLIKSTSITMTGKAIAQIFLNPEAAINLPRGNNTGTLIVKACKNKTCSAQYSGSPASVTVKYKVVDKPSKSSSSSSSSSSPSLACTNSPGDVFYDEVCAPWRSVSAYEQNYADYTNAYETTDGNTAAAARFNIIQSVDVGRNQVLDIEYASAPEFFGAVRIRVPESETNSLDMSDYANGKIIFDLKVINHGFANAPLEFNLDCSWPCSSTPKFIRADVLNAWKTYEFSVAEMIDRGLDIQRVSMGFMLLPAWGKQAGAHYQVDNIRWVKGAAQTGTEKTCYANFFDTPWLGGLQGVGVSVMGLGQSIPVEAMSSLTQGVVPLVTTTPDWSLLNNEWLYMFSTAMNYQTGDLLDPFALPNCSAEGTLSLEIFTPAALVADGQMTFNLVFVDRDLGWMDIPGGNFSVATMRADEWNKVSVSLSAATYKNNWKFVGMRINASAVSPALQAGFNVDNILIKQVTH